MTYAENTHVEYTDGSGTKIVGIVKGYSGGSYTIQLKDNTTTQVSEDKVTKYTTSDAAHCPVVGHGK